jgi:hypothetical protein
VLAGLGEHFDAHVVGNVAALDEAAHEAELGFEADGKATSISLKPMAQSILNICIFLSAFIGSKRAWLPSRRSVLIQTGGVDDAARPLAVGELDRRKAVYLAAGWKSCPAPECFSDGEI